MKRLFLSLLLFSLLIKLSAKSADCSFGDFSQYYVDSDTVPYEIDEDEMADFNDSLILFPAYDLYCNWDTINIHSPKFDVATLKDSSYILCLYDESSCGYYHPFSGRVTSDFGPRKRRYHYGIDIDLETGDKVAAAFDGKVRIAKKSKSYGNVVVIRHSNGLETYYAHLSKINVEIGQEVFAGDNIGLGGNTGRSRGSHLHFEVRYLGQPINPNNLISFNDKKLLADTLCLNKKTFAYISDAKKVALKQGGKGAVTYKNGVKVYTVRKGDTLSGIARRYGTTVSNICKKNGIKSTAILRLGQKLKV